MTDADSAAFGRDTESFRRELFAHCYRMLGAVADADRGISQVTSFGNPGLLAVFGFPPEPGLGR